jgi:hypothetical protein
LVAVESVFGVDSSVVFVDGCEALDFFVFFGVRSAAVVLVSLESFVVSAFSPDCCFLCDADAPAVDEVLEVDDDPDPEVVDGSADATPYPRRTAAPIPRATASAPTRPT